MRVIDFRSDTKTLPSPEMRRAMAEAELGDDVAGEDPTVNRLEALAAEMLGKEAAVLVTSGSQGNLVGILSQCQRGDEVLIGDTSHIARAEAKGASVLGGVAIQTLRTDDRGMFDPDDMEAAIKDGSNRHENPTALLTLENTHNYSGGSVLTPEDTKAMAGVARAHDVPVHMDGARIFNAAVHLECPVAELAKDVDTVTFCLSKGLGAPVGSLLCGSEETIEEARRWRKMLGAGDAAGGDHRRLRRSGAGVDGHPAGRGPRQRSQAGPGAEQDTGHRDRAGEAADQPGLLRGRGREPSGAGEQAGGAGDQGGDAGAALAVRAPLRHHFGRHRVHPGRDRGDLQGIREGVGASAE